MPIRKWVYLRQWVNPIRVVPRGGQKVSKRGKGSSPTMSHMPMNELGQHLRSRREALGLSLAELQEMTGIDKSDLSKIERGQRKMNRSDSRDPLLRLSKALGADPDAILAMAGHVPEGQIRERKAARHAVEAAVLADPTLTAEDRAHVLRTIAYIRASRRPAPPRD